MRHGNKPRVLFLYDFPLHGGGSGAYVKYLMMRLKDLGYNLALAAPDKEVIEGIPHFHLNLPQIPVFIGRPGLEGAKRFNELSMKEITDLYSAYVDGTRRAVEAFHPDIIHVHHIMINAWAARVARSLYGSKIILTSHGSCIHLIQKDRRYLRLTRDALRAANAITVVSGDTRAKLLRMFGSDLGQKTRTIPGGIRMSLFPLNRPTQGLREKYGIGEGKIAMFTGRIISEKGVEYLVKAAKTINGQVVIAGDGPQRSHLEELIKKMNLSNAKILPFIKSYPEFLDLYYLADVFVSPAVWDEPLGLTILEAMASRTPVIVTRKGGVTMAVKDGMTGVFVRPRNATEIASAVNKLFANDDVRKKMGERGRKIVEEKFTWTHIAEKFDKLYWDVLLYR